MYKMKRIRPSERATHEQGCPVKFSFAFERLSGSNLKYPTKKKRTKHVTETVDGQCREVKLMFSSAVIAATTAGSATPQTLVEHNWPVVQMAGPHMHGNVVLTTAPVKSVQASAGVPSQVS